MKEEQKKLALDLFKDFKKEPFVMNQGKKELSEEFDKERIEALNKIKKVLFDYFNKSISLDEFKQEVDSLNKRNSYWGFRGVNGQMFFNMVYKVSKDKKHLNEILLDVLKSPLNIQEAKIKLKKFIEFVRENSKNIDKIKAPRIKSTNFFISYFWQIQDPEKWPIFYNSLEQMFVALNFLEQKDDLPEYYESFYNLNMEIYQLYKKEESKTNLWLIEHVFWKYFMQQQEIEEPVEKEKAVAVPTYEKSETILDYIPPIISDLISLSLNEANPANFEKKTAILFNMLGFDVEPWGQGKGRMIDIIARANLEKPYIILIDCKARSNKDFRFNAGEERTVVEYVKNFNSKYPRDSKFEKHYLIVSSGFRNDDEEIRRKVKGEIGMDITLIPVNDLLFLLAKKLQNCFLDIEKMREIFQREGLISKDIIQDIIGR